MYIFVTLGRCPLILSSKEELLVKNYITYVNQSIVAVLQNDSSNQSFVLHCNREGYWNWRDLFSSWSMRDDRNFISK